MSAQTVDEVFAELHRRGLVADAQPPALPAAGPDTPWYVRVMAGFGAWLGGLFLLGSIMAFFTAAMRSAGAVTVVGVIALAAAFWLYRVARDSDAVQQLALAASMAGQFAIGFGLSEVFHWRDTSIAGMLLLLQIALVLAMPNGLHRFLSTWFAAIAGYYFLYQLHAQALGAAILAVMVVLVWLNEAAWTAAGRAALCLPVGYALALALLFWQAPYSVEWLLDWRGRAGVAVPAMLAPLAYALCLAATAAVLARRHAPGKLVLWVVVALLVSAAAWLAPGLIAALLVLILGEAAGRRGLVGLALLGVVWYLGTYYYRMNLTLLEKSWVMLGTGMLLIALRFVLNRVWREEAR
jgi:uncharacterized membrane protein